MSRMLNEEAFSGAIGAFCEAVVNVMADPKSAKKVAENLSEAKEVKKQNESVLLQISEKEVAAAKKIELAEAAEKKSAAALEKLKAKEALLKEGFDSLKLGEKDLTNKLKAFEEEKAEFDKQGAKLDRRISDFDIKEKTFLEGKVVFEQAKKEKEEKLKAALESL